MRAEITKNDGVSTQLKAKNVFGDFVGRKTITKAMYLWRTWLKMGYR